MAEEVIITLKVDKSKADKSLDGIEKSVDKAKKSTDGLNKSASKTPKALKKISTGMKAIGTAIKAAGIGLLIGLFVKLTQVLGKNQKVMDAINKVMTTVEIAISQVVDATIAIYESIRDNTTIFESFGKVIGGLITIYLTPLKLLFFGLKGGLLELQLAWEKSIFGSGDDGTIDELNKKIKENKDTLKETAEEAVKAGKDVVEGVKEVASEAGKIYGIASKELNKINVERAASEAERLVQMRRNIQIEEALLEGLQLKYQQQAETLRQIRDNTEASIEDRIKANKELGDLLIEQAEEEEKIARKKVALLQSEIDAGDQSAETAAELIRANNKILEIEERITSQKSEQLINEKGLRKEKEENLKQIELIGKTEREEAEITAKQKRDDQRKLIEKTIEDDEELKEALLKNEAEYNNTLADIEEEKLQKIEDVKNKFLPEDEQGLSEAEKFEKERERKRGQFEKELEDRKEEQEEIARLLEEFDDRTKEKAIANAEEEAERKKKLKEQEVGMYLGALSTITSAIAEGSDAAKGFAVAEATWSAYKAINAALADEEIPFPLRVANSVAIGAMAFKNIQGIINTDENTAGNTNAGNRTNTITQGPRFDVAGDSSRVMNAQEESDREPQKSYVVSKEVSNQQELDRNKNNNSRFI